MRPIARSYEIQNEYTNPLSGKPYYRNSGIIYAVDRSGDKYAVSRVDFERFDEQNFQYIFSPEWSVIDTLPASIFQGIPGLDMSFRLERYYRVNMTPYFISERTPSEGREDLWELLDEVGLDYYDRFEWLLRSNMRCGTDNLIVERAEAPRRIIFESIDLLPANLQPSDCVSIKGIIQNDVGNRYSPTVIAAAITSRMGKTRLPTHIDIYAEKAGLSKDSVILLEQIRTLDKKRLREKMGRLDEGVMHKVDSALAVSMGLNTSVSQEEI